MGEIASTVIHTRLLKRLYAHLNNMLLTVGNKQRKIQGTPDIKYSALKNRKAEVAKKLAGAGGGTGSTEVRVALLTDHIDTSSTSTSGFTRRTTTPSVAFSRWSANAAVS